MHTQIVPGTLKSEFTLDTSEHQDISARIPSEKRMGGGGGGGGRKEKKSNKFRSRLADIMSICHLAPHAE